MERTDPLNIPALRSIYVNACRRQYWRMIRQIRNIDTGHYIM